MAANMTLQIIISPLTLLPCYAVSRMIDFACSSGMFYFLIFRGRFNQLSGVWHTVVGPRDLTECRDADTVWEQQRYQPSRTIARKFSIKCSSLYKVRVISVLRFSLTIPNLVWFARIFSQTYAASFEQLS